MKRAASLIILLLAPPGLVPALAAAETSFPANPGGIMGLTRWGPPFTQIANSKGATVENRAWIEDLTRTSSTCPKTNGRRS